MKKSWLLPSLAILFCFSVVACSSPPPIPDGGKDGTTKTTPETGVPDQASKLELAWSYPLPRQIFSLYVEGDLAFACSPEGDLYDKNKEQADVTSFRLTALNLRTGKVQWAAKRTGCQFRSNGKSVFILRKTADKSILDIEQVDRLTGEKQRTFQVYSSQCQHEAFMGSGEKMMSIQAGAPSCLNFSATADHLLYTDQKNVQLFDLNTGKAIHEEKTNDEGVGRFVNVTLHNNVLYTMYAAKTTASKSKPATLEDDSKTFPVWKYQVKALSLETNKQLWNVGPLENIVLQAKMVFDGDMMILQTIQTTDKGPADAAGTLEYAMGRNYSLSTKKVIYALKASSGDTMWFRPWEGALHFRTASKTQPTGTSFDLPAPLLMKDKGTLFVQKPSGMDALDLRDGKSVLWSISKKDLHEDELRLVSQKYLQIRSVDGSTSFVTLHDNGPGTYDTGMLMYSSEMAMSAPKPSTSAPNAPKKTPVQAIL